MQRRCETIILDRSTLNEMIQPVLPGQSVEDFELMAEGLINSNYKISVTGSKHKTFLIRVYARDPDACPREAEILSLIKDNVAVPEVLYSSTSDSIIGRPYAVLQWCEGVLLHQISNNEQRTPNVNSAFYAAGEALACIGTHKFEQSGQFGKGPAIEHPFPFMRACLENEDVRRRLGESMCERLPGFILEHAHCLEKVEACLVHGDFNGKNILVKQENDRWIISAVLDWEWAHAGTPLFDVGSMLRYKKRHPDMESHFIKGFQSAGGQLQSNWKQASSFIDLNNLLEFLTGTEEREWLFEEARQLIESTMLEWDGLA